MFELLQRQQEFFALTCRLISKIISLGYSATWGDAYRDPRCPYGHPKSLHKMRLAVDINLFIGGNLLAGDDAYQAHKIIHEWWETVGGSPMIEGDGNHYSLPFGGMR